VVRYSAPELLHELLDAGTFRSWDTGPAESVITGEGLLGGHRVAVAASDFGFLGGSIGVAAGERLTLAVERATARRLPLIAMPASGGTRMQEGTIAFLQMLKVTAVVTAHKAAGLPYLVYLRHPTTGGVLASWASLGQVTLAEPGALIGFLGPRVHEALQGIPVPPGVQTAENLHAHGLVDAIVAPAGLGAWTGRALTALRAPAVPAADHDAQRSDGARPSSPVSGAGPGADVDAWECVLRTRMAGRPGAADLLRVLDPSAVAVREDGGLSLALARVAGSPAVIAGQHRGVPLAIAGLRLARRGMQVAVELGCPFVSVIDTPGAELSAAAEDSGIAGEIARCLAQLINVRVPTVAVLLGQGAGGGALALLPADRVLAAAHAWLAPLAPEGASAIVYRDTAHAPELARAQGIRGADLAAAGVVDQVIAEDGNWPAALAAALRAELAARPAISDEERRAARMHRFRALLSAGKQRKWR
jgi:acyl-CoA carboxylase subunit beta